MHVKVIEFRIKLVQRVNCAKLNIFLCSTVIVMIIACFRATILIVVYEH